MTPADNPGRRAADGSDVPEPRVSAPAPERSLWAKADLLDPAANRRPTPGPADAAAERAEEPGTHETAGDGELPQEPGHGQADRRPDNATRRHQRPEPPLWRKADALDCLLEAGAPGVPTGRTPRPDSRDTPRDAYPPEGPRPSAPDTVHERGSDRFLFPAHEQKYREITEHERPLVNRVADVVKRNFEDRSPEAWNDTQGRQRMREVTGIVEEIRSAMNLPPIRVKLSNDPDIFGTHRYHRGVHHLEINRDLDLETTLATLVHEIRHVYQTEAIEGRSHSHPDADAWDRNDQRYIEYDGSNAVEHFTQPLEADAFGFEGAVGKSLRLDWPNL